MSLDASRFALCRSGLFLALLMTVAAVAGCSRSVASAEASRFGPLALVPGHPGGDQARTEGNLHVTKDCVFLDERGEDVLLVWPDDRTSWDPISRSVLFERADGIQVTLRNGDAVAFGGGGESVDEGGRTAEDWVAGIEWTVEPKPGCVTDSRWFVTDLAP